MNIIKRKEGPPTLDELLATKKDIESDIATYRNMNNRNDGNSALFFESNYAGTRKSYRNNRISELKRNLYIIESQIQELIGADK